MKDIFADMGKIELSILIPVFNVGVYLPELLESLLPNLPVNVEVIFYDDCSQDDSLAIIRKYQQIYPDAFIRVLCGQENKGITQVRQCLLHSTQAEYIWFIDSDDKVESLAVQQIMGILKQYRPDVLLFDYDVFFDNTGKLKSKEHLSIAPANTLLHQKNGNLFHLAIMDGKHYFWNKVFRRQLATKVCRFTIPAYEDIANTPSLLHECQTYFYYPQVLVHYRIWPNSIVQKMSPKQVYGIEAYLTQAFYAETIVGDEKCCAYLLYKAHLYYFRLCRKLAKTAMPEKEKKAILHKAAELFVVKRLSIRTTILLLLRTHLWDKAAKLMLKSALFTLTHK